MSNDMVPRLLTGREANLIYKTCLSGECDVCDLFRPNSFEIDSSARVVTLGQIMP